MCVEKVRGFTEIEIAILMRIISQMLNLMREPWENVTELRPVLDRIETNAQFAQLMSPNEMVALITFTAKIGEMEGLLNVCIPHMTVEPIMPKLSTRLWFSLIERESTEESKQAISLKIEETNIPVKAVLGRTSISVHDFLMLQQGDVVPLNTSIDDKVEVFVGDILKFRGKPGARNKRLAVKITDVIKEEEE